MNSAVTSPIAVSTLLDRLLPVGDSMFAKSMRAMLLTVVCAQLLWVSAKMQVPFWPVPMTMQTYAILTIAGLAGWRIGLATVTLYLAQGAIGMPVFAGTPEKGIGLAYMVGPTGGYLVGFMLAAVLAGLCSEIRGKLRFISVVLGMIAAHVIVFVPGIAWLSAFMGFEGALMFNITNFWLATILKTALAIATVYGVWQLTGGERKAKPAAE